MALEVVIWVLGSTGHGLMVFHLEETPGDDRRLEMKQVPAVVAALALFSNNDVVILIHNNNLREHGLWLRPELLGNRRWLDNNTSFVRSWLLLAMI